VNAVATPESAVVRVKKGEVRSQQGVRATASSGALWEKDVLVFNADALFMWNVTA